MSLLLAWFNRNPLGRLTVYVAGFSASVLIVKIIKGKAPLALLENVTVFMKTYSKPHKILLADAPYHDLYGNAKGAVSYYFPLGIGYIASYLQSHGYQVEILAESKQVDVFNTLAEKLNDQNFLFVGISSMTPSFPRAVKLAKIVRDVSPETPRILGGSHVSGMGPCVLEDHSEFDFLCIGEGEITTLEFAEAIESNRQTFNDIKGLVWRDKDTASVIVNDPRPFHSNIDDFPPPARHLVDLKSFSLHSHVAVGKGPGATMLTSRGCPFGCIFCSAHLTDGKKYRFRSNDYVTDELKVLRDKYKVRYVFFEDDTLTVVRKRLKSLCKRINEENLGLTFGCFSRADVFNEQTAEILSEAEFRLVIFGIESGVPEILKKIGKTTSLEQAHRAVGLCRRYGIKSYASFVVGFPFETRKDIEKTITFAKSLEASVLTINPFVPFPGTPLFNHDKHKPHEVTGWSRFLTTDSPPFDLVPGLSARQLKDMVDRAHLDYYIRPKRLLKMVLEIQSIGELSSLFRSFTGFLGRILLKH